MATVAPFYCQATNSTLLNPCCNSTLVQPVELKLYQCNFTDGAGIRSCLSKFSAVENGTYPLSCSDQKISSPNSATRGAQMGWRLQAFTCAVGGLLALSLLGTPVVS